MGIDGVLPEHSVGGALAFQRLPQIQTFLLVEPADGIDERLIGLLDTLPCSNPSANVRLPSATCFSSVSWRAQSNTFSSSSRTHTD